MRSRSSNRFGTVIMPSAAEDAAIRRGIARDPDNPELTKSDFARMRPAGEMVPALVGAFQRARGAQKFPTKQLVSLRLDRDVIEHFRRRGPGWQRHINEALRKAARLKPLTAKRAIKGGSPRARP